MKLYKYYDDLLPSVEVDLKLCRLIRWPPHDIYEHFILNTGMYFYKEELNEIICR